MNHLLKQYNSIKTRIIDFGYIDEIKWQSNIDFTKITEQDFLRECAWVILCAGMSEKIVRKCFLNISLSFFEWESAKKIIRAKNLCAENALRFFNNYKKIDAIVTICEHISKIGFRKLKEKLLRDPLKILQGFPYIGKITVFHLAKNLGLPFSKADRHLQRIATKLNFPDVQSMCSYISHLSGDLVQVVDIVLWRYATINKSYLDYFAT